MDTKAINEFIDLVNASNAAEDTKASYIKFANEAMNDPEKARALKTFISNFTTNGDLDPEIWDVAADGIEDFYNDYTGGGSDTVLMDND